jgi:hypothetical protein
MEDIDMTNGSNEKNKDESSPYYNYDQYQPQYRYSEKSSFPIGTVVIGGAIIAIAGIGIYYMWSKQKIVDDYLYWVQEYMREVEEYGPNPTSAQQDELKKKKETIIFLQGQAEEKNVIVQIQEALIPILGLIAVIKFTTILYKIVEWYLKNHPGAGGGTPGNEYHDVVDGTDHPSPEDFMRHTATDYPHPDPAGDVMPQVWTDIQTLPQWILDILAGAALSLGINEWADAIGKSWSELPAEQQLYLAVVVLGLVLLVITMSCGTAAPWLMPIAMALLA